MTWTSGLLTGVCELAAAQVPGFTYRDNGLYQPDETGIVRKAMPPGPDRVVVVNTYVPGGDGARSEQLLAIQFRCRGLPNDPDDPDDMADELYRVFHRAENVTVGPAQLALVWRQSYAQAGKDSSNRFETTSNFYAITDHHSDHALD